MFSIYRFIAFDLLYMLENSVQFEIKVFKCSNVLFSLTNNKKNKDIKYIMID